MLPLDDIDRQILAVLQQDGRVSNLDLARQVGLSPTPCQRRVRRLETAGVIEGYTAVISPAAVDLGVSVFITVRLEAQSKTAVQAFVDAVRTVDEITDCHLVAGAFDYMLRVRLPHVDALRAFVVETLVLLPNVASTATHLILEETKTTSVLPIR